MAIEDSLVTSPVNLMRPTTTGAAGGVAAGVVTAGVVAAGGAATAEDSLGDWLGCRLAG